MTNALWEKLQPETWPFPLSVLPSGSALVGGAVRDGLIDQMRSTKDLDFVSADLK